MTRGPYEPGTSNKGDLCIYTSDTEDRVGGDPVAIVMKDVGGHEMPYESNARLLAASYEMYEALNALTCEVAGITALESLRPAIGALNYNCLFGRLNAARDVLDKVRKGVPA